MTELHKNKLTILSEDKAALEALNEIFLKNIEAEKPISLSVSDEDLGQQYRAYTTAKIILNNTLLDIQSYKDIKVDSKITNKGK